MTGTFAKAITDIRAQIADCRGREAAICTDVLTYVCDALRDAGIENISADGYTHTVALVREWAPNEANAGRALNALRNALESERADLRRARSALSRARECLKEASTLRHGDESKEEVAS